ncbi:MAG: C40 family peptidase [Chitinophagales bacterium]|nr:C40 family peptidase [Chitinophagales bacterium]
MVLFTFSPRHPSPFEMLTPGRNWSAGSEYRFGFQDAEQDDEVKGNGNSIHFTFREYDPRLGKFLSIDPLNKKYPYWSHYAFSGNRLIDARELEGLEPERVTETATDYEGTPYEFGGKKPAFKNGLPEEMTENTYLDKVGWPSSKTGSRYNNPNYSNKVNLNQYLKDGATSCGIDCSGLAGTAFNADEQKLMQGFNLYNQGAQAQREAFSKAEKGENNNGFLGKDFQKISQGDLIFNGNETTKSTHVMVATGQKKINEQGQTQIQVIHAPQTGKYVNTEWRTVGTKWSYGHTFRNTDNVFPAVIIEGDRPLPNVGQ